MLFAVFFLSSIFISTANGWGEVGHSLVARIAQSLLTDSSTKFVRDHLAWYTNGNLSMLSSWPDSILYPESNPVECLNWQWSSQLHYVNTPDWNCTYNRQRDCNWTVVDERRCVDGAVQNYTKRLANTSLDDIQRQEALRFLVHFIGDTHQPLHAGFAGDKGGNTISGTFFSKKTELHKLWDRNMIEHRLADFSNDIDKYYDYLLNALHTTYAANVSQWLKCPYEDEATYLACSTAWIDEGVELDCAHVYRDENNQPLDPFQEFHFAEVYYETNLVFLEQRLIQGGVRLGAVINKIVELQKGHHHRDNSNDQICTGTLFLFALILLQILLALFGVTYCLMNRRNNRQPLNEKPPEFDFYSTHKA